MRVGVLLLCAVVLLHVVPAHTRKIGCFKPKVKGFFGKKVGVGKQKNASVCGRKCMVTRKRLTHFIYARDTKRCTCLESPKTKISKKSLRSARVKVCKRSGTVKLYTAPRRRRFRRPRKFRPRRSRIGCFRPRPVRKFFKERRFIGKQKNAYRCGVKCMRKRFTHIMFARGTNKCTCLKRPKKSVNKVLRRLSRKKLCSQRGKVKLYRLPKKPRRRYRKPRKFRPRKSKIGCFRPRPVRKFFKERRFIGKQKNAYRCGVKCMRKRFTHIMFARGTNKCTCLKRPKKSVNKVLRRLSRKKLCSQRGKVKLYRLPKKPRRRYRKPRKFRPRKSKIGCFQPRPVRKFFKGRRFIGKQKNAYRCGVKCMRKRGRFTHIMFARGTNKCTCLKRPKKSVNKVLRRRSRKKLCIQRGKVKLYKLPKKPRRRYRKPRKFIPRKFKIGCFQPRRVWKFFKGRRPNGKQKNAYTCGVKCMRKRGRYTHIMYMRGTKRCTCLKRPKKSVYKVLRRFAKRAYCGQRGKVKLYRLPKKPRRRPRKFIPRKSKIGCFRPRRVRKFFKSRRSNGKQKNAYVCGIKCMRKRGRYTHIMFVRATKRCTCLKRPKRSISRRLKPLRETCRRSKIASLYRLPKKSKRRPRKGRCPTRLGYKKRKTGCYAVFRQAFTWPEAAIFCFVEGARLVEINNKRKNKDVAALARSLKRDVWIGANDIIQENALRFIGTNRGIRGFFKKGIRNNRKKNCVKLSRSSKWRAVNCNQRRPFICERYPRRWE